LPIQKSEARRWFLRKGDCFHDGPDNITQGTQARFQPWMRHDPNTKHELMMKKLKDSLWHFFFLRGICMSVITLVCVNSKQSKVYIWSKFQNLNPGISIRTFQFESLSFKFWTNYYFYYLFLVCFRSRFAVVQKLYFRLIDRMWAEVSSVDGTEVLKERYIIPDTSFIEFLVILRITNFEMFLLEAAKQLCQILCIDQYPVQLSLYFILYISIIFLYRGSSRLEELIYFFQYSWILIKIQLKRKLFSTFLIWIVSWN